MRIVLAGVLLLTAVGCGGGRGDPEMASVSGKVTLDGKPLDDGTITFTPPNGGVPASGSIKAGLYTVKAPAGPNRVTIVAYKDDTNAKVDMGAKKAENKGAFPVSNKTNYIPDEYNKLSKVTADVASGKTFDYDLVTPKTPAKK